MDDGWPQNIFFSLFNSKSNYHISQITILVYEGILLTLGFVLYHSALPRSMLQIL